MSHKHRPLLLFLSLCICFSVVIIPTNAQTRTTSVSTICPPSVSAQSAVLLEADSGTVIYEKDADHRLPMASTTKLMTALAALELSPPSRLIRIPAEAVGVEGSSIYLTEGENLTLEQLLYALLLESANDAAAAIAIALSGSIEEFAAQMNRKAAELGLTDTHFTNPHGLDEEAHYTTARELALIARAALDNELLATICATRKTTIPHVGEDGARLLVNHNKLLRLYDGCIGMKTGFTKHSGRTLVSAAKRDGVTLIAVTLNAPDDWTDHTALLDYGFSRYRAHTLCEIGDLVYSLPLVGGKEDYVLLGNRSAVSVTIPSSAGEIRQALECRRFEYAGIEEGDVLGYAVFFSDTDGNGIEEQLAKVPLYALYTVEKTERPSGFGGFWKKLFT